MRDEFKIFVNWGELPHEKQRWITVIGIVDEKIVSECRVTNWNSPTPQLGSLYTRPGYRRKGYATRLIQECIEIVQAGQKIALVLTVHPNNPEAERLYRKLGFATALVDSTGAHWMSLRLKD